MSEYLPQDIMIKILSKLAPKHLIIFRMVSKSYYFMISSQFFINLHTENTLLLNTPTTSNQLIVRRYSKTLKREVYSVHTDNKQFRKDDTIKIEYPLQDDIRFYNRIVGSCNGVMCILDDQFGDAGDIHLWNPAIMRKLKLPPPIVNWDKCTIVLGFGFDAWRHDYKVVKITYVPGDGKSIFPPTVEVYSLGTRRWHTVACDIPDNYVPEHFWSQAVVNGNVHWVAFKMKGRSSTKIQNVMMVFNLTLEVFDEMPVPEPLASELTFHFSALEVHGALAVVHYDERVWCSSVCIWVMRRYGDGSSWSRDYSIDHDGGIGVVHGVRRNGDILMNTRFGVLASHDQVTEKYGNLGLCGTRDSFYVGPYRESLVLLAEGVLARQRLPSDDEVSDGEGGSDGDVEYQDLVNVEEDEDDDEDEDEDEDDDEDGESESDVETSEFKMKSSMCQYLTPLLSRPYI